MAQIEVEGIRIAYERAGQGQPLLLLHGFFGDTRVWSPQLEELSDEYEVVAWDTPGCGYSSDPPETFCMAGPARPEKIPGCSRQHVMGTHPWLGRSVADPRWGRLSGEATRPLARRVREGSAALRSLR